MRNRRSTWWLVAALALPGCKKDEEAVPHAEGPAPGLGEPAAAELEDPAATPTPARPLALPPSAVGPLIGHVRLAPIAGLVDKTRAQLVPAPLGALVTADMARAALMDDTKDETVRAVLEHLSLSQPIVCGVVDPLEHDVPVGCAFGYEGGVAQLVADVETRVSVAPPDGHAAHFRNDKGEDLYLDERDGFVLASANAELAAVAGPALVGLARAPARRDFELVIYPSGVLGRYLPLVRDELEQVATGTSSGSALRKRLEERVWSQVQERLRRMEVTLDEGDTSVFEDVLAALDALTPTEAKRVLAELDAAASSVAELQALGVGFELEPAGLVFSAWYDAAPSSTLQKKALAGPKLDLAWVALLPESSGLAGASVESPGDPDEKEGFVEQKLSHAFAKHVADLYASQTGNPREMIEADLLAWLTAREELYGPRRAWALYTGPKGPGALVVVRDNQPGKSGREGWAQWGERFSATRILGADLLKYVTWEHRAGAAEIEGLPVDRFSLHLTRALGEALKDELFVSPVGEALVEGGGWKVQVDRVEKDGRTTFVLTTKGSDAFLRAALAAQGGGSAPAGLSTILARGPHPTSLWGLDVRKVVELAEASSKEAKALRGVIGTDLSDVYGVTYLREDGGTAELVISQRLIDQVRAAAMK